MTEVVNQATYTLADILINDIDIGNRRRKDFGDVDVLAGDIDQFGLYHPILVVEKSFVPDLAEDESLDKGKPYLLLAGERRLRACLQLSWLEVPAKINQHVLNEWEIKIIELHENLQRKSMTPLENASAKAELHKVYTKLHGETQAGPQGGGHKISDTADLLNMSRMSVSNALEIDKFSEIIPELKEAKTQSDAMRLVRDLKEKLAREELARRAEKKSFLAQKKESRPGESIDSRRGILTQRYVLGDFYDEIANIPARTLDLIELDPDWGIEFREKLEKRGQINAADYETLQPEEFEIGLARMLKACYKVMKDNSWLIYWYSIEDWHDTSLRILKEAGFQACKMPGFWIHDSGYTGTPAYRLAQTTESFIYARKGNVRIGDMGRHNTFKFRTARKDERGHPAEKPIELYMDIIQTFIGKDNKGNTMLTGFAGSGNFILAADNLKHNAIGFDSGKPYRDKFVLKVNQEVPGEYRTYKKGSV